MIPNLCLTPYLLRRSPKLIGQDFGCWGSKK